MAELTTPAETTTNSCCAPEAQATCCEPSAKAECCEPSHDEGCGCAAGTADIREQVRERYAAAAVQVTTTDPGAGCCAPSETFDGGSEVFGAALYALGDHEQLPDTAKLASLGCGNPTAVAELHEGETVLDLGSGGGIDVLLSAKRVGPTGKAHGLDMTDEMLALARENARKAGVENVEFHKGYIEEIPLSDASVDVVISNCVINLSGDKPKVLREIARVLRPGGRFAVSDVIADESMDDATRADMQAYTGCIAGALTPRVHPSARRCRLGRCRDTRDPSRPRAGNLGDCARTQAERVSGMSEPTHEVHLHDPQTLYRHWEESQWSPWDVDLSDDREQWAAMEDRSLVSFVLGSLMVAEERITTKFSGLVGADGSEEEVTFLATQQVDEARHMQFYARFQDEVVSEPSVIAAHVQRARAQVSAAFQTIFDDKLVAAHDRLLANPGDRAAKVAFVTIYHLILEATLGLTTFEFSTRFLAREGLLPGFVEGYTKIHHDEHRHIGYGIWFLRQAISEDERMGDVVRGSLRELLPAVAESLTPPAGADASVLGASADDLRSFALDGLTRRLKIIGVPLDTL